MKKHIYFVPGTAANSKIFDRIKLDDQKYEMHFLTWHIPSSKNQSIESYASELCQQVTHKNPILIGVSFGGIMVQEMSKIIDYEKLVIISSIKNKYELPKGLKIIKKLKLYTLAPTRIIVPLEQLLTLSFGKKAKKQIEAYRMYLSQRDATYLKWSIKKVLFWDQEKSISNIIHIHGTKDFIFPIESIENFISIEKGSHAMILTKAQKINKILSQELT